LPGALGWGIRLVQELGVAGVARYEHHRARSWANRLEIPLLLIALWIPSHWCLIASGNMDPQVGLWVD